MTYRSQILEGLTEALEAANASARQYARHANLCQAWGHPRLGADLRSEAVGEQVLGEQILRRIHALTGTGDVQREPDAPISVLEMLERDLNRERDSVRSSEGLIRLCRRANDSETLELMQSCLRDGEAQIDRLEAQIDQIDEVGLEAFLYEESREAAYA